MARFKSINEGTSGKVGQVITYQMYGKSYMRSLPGQYNDKKSEKQLAQRQKMQLVNSFLAPYKDVLRLTYQDEAVGHSAYMAAKSYNMLNAIDGEYPEQEIDLTKALVSSGSVQLPEVASVEHTDDGLLIKWEAEKQMNSSDSLFVIANLRGQYVTYHKQTEALRRDESYLWKLEYDGVDKFDIWLVFRDYKERGFSNSMWLGLV